jgi:SPP1 family predicted phage head-tail adaptor
MLWKPLEAGDMDKRVRLVKPTKAATKTTFGSTPMTPKVLAEVWASVEDVGGGNPWYAEQASPDTTHLIKIRYLDWVNERFEVLYGPGWKRVFEILSVDDPEQRHEQLVIQCKEKTFSQA